MSPWLRRARRSDPFSTQAIRRRRKQRQRARARRRRRIVLVVLALALPLAAGSATIGLTGASAVGSKCDLKRLRPVTIGQNTFVYAADGSLLGSIPAEKNRTPVALEAVSPWMRKATIAIEDRRFYAHGGIDFTGIVRAAWADARAGKVVQGGSTITQQLVRNLYIGNEVTVERKLTEACLAIKLTHRKSKDWILAQYMNQVYYGNHAYGVEAASQTYFSRRSRNLTLAQAALLAGLPQAPSVFDPFNRPTEAVARRNDVLRAMLGSGDLTREQYEAAAAQELTLKPGRLYTRIYEPYFFSYVREELLREYGANTVRSGGLRVYTTIDRRFQRAAQKAISETLYEKTDPSAAVIAIDPSTGAIRAMTAITPTKKGNQFNLASQARRQSGSTFKTFVLTEAVNRGVNPDTTSYTSAPFRYSPDPTGDCEDETAWCVETYSKTYLGSTSVAHATLASDNTVYAQLTLDLGPETVAAMAHKLGVRSTLRSKEGSYVPSLGLGAMSVSPLDMASAYATLAAGGIYSKPTAIRKVVLPDGETDTDAGWGEPVRRRVIPDGVAYTVTRILEQNIQGGTGVGAQIGRTAAGKTGTTDRHTDAWFCGYTPNLSTTVWIGYPQGQVPMESVHGISVAGGTFPADIWQLFMSSALEGTAAIDWTQPTEFPLWRPLERGQYVLGETSSRDTAPEPTTTAKPKPDDEHENFSPPAPVSPRGPLPRRDPIEPPAPPEPIPPPPEPIPPPPPPEPLPPPPPPPVQ